MKPTSEQALQFAVMLQAGLPPSKAIVYFTEIEDPAELGELLRGWMRSRVVASAMATLMGKSWQDMTLDEQITHARNTHYAQLAYILFSNHYGEVGATDKSKLDTARGALEAFQAGNAGKGDAMSRFFDDINSGKVKLTMPVKVPVN